MRKHSKVILHAEERLIFGHSLPEMVAARDSLRSVLPGSLLLDLLNSRIARKEWSPGGPQAHGPRSVRRSQPGGGSGPVALGHLGELRLETFDLGRQLDRGESR